MSHQMARRCIDLVAAARHMHTTPLIRHMSAIDATLLRALRQSATSQCLTLFRHTAMPIIRRRHSYQALLRRKAVTPYAASCHYADLRHCHTIAHTHIRIPSGRRWPRRYTVAAAAAAIRQKLFLRPHAIVTWWYTLLHVAIRCSHCHVDCLSSQPGQLPPAATANIAIRRHHGHYYQHTNTTEYAVSPHAAYCQSHTPAITLRHHNETPRHAPRPFMPGYAAVIAVITPRHALS